MQSGEKKVWSWGRKKAEPVPGLNSEDKNVYKKISGHGKIRNDKEPNYDFKYQLQENFASIY
jgi:hypothetical protein